MATPKSLDLLVVGGPPMKKKPKEDEAESPRELAMKGFIEAVSSGDVKEALAAFDTLEAAEEKAEEPEGNEEVV
jgi:hypothetical protein